MASAARSGSEWCETPGSTSARMPGGAVGAWGYRVQTRAKRE